WLLLKQMHEARRYRNCLQPRWRHRNSQGAVPINQIATALADPNLTNGRCVPPVCRIYCGHEQCFRGRSRQCIGATGRRGGRVETSRTWRRGMRLDILSVWNHAAFIENGTAGQKTNTARVSSMTNTKSSTFQSVFTEQEITSRRSMNCLG